MSGPVDTSVLFDAPGPRARLRNNALSLLALIAIVAVVYFST